MQKFKRIVFVLIIEANRRVLDLALKELRVAADLQFSASLFQICGAYILNAASPGPDESLGGS